MVFDKKCCLFRRCGSQNYIQCKSKLKEKILTEPGQKDEATETGCFILLAQGLQFTAFTGTFPHFCGGV
jgi:hypothetical protein